MVKVKVFISCLILTKVKYFQSQSWIFVWRQFLSQNSNLNLVDMITAKVCFLDQNLNFNKNYLSNPCWNITKPVHEINAGHRSLSGTISCVTERIRFLPVTMTGRFSNFNSKSYREDRHKMQVIDTKCQLPDTMSGTSEIFISGAVRPCKDVFIKGSDTL